MNISDKKEELLAKLFILLAITSFLPALILYALGFNTLDPERTPDLKGTALQFLLTLPIFAYTIYFAYKSIEEFKKPIRFVLENVNITKFFFANVTYIFLAVSSHNGIKLTSSDEIGLMVFCAFYLLPWVLTFYVKGIPLILKYLIEYVVFGGDPDEKQKPEPDCSLNESKDEKRKEAILKLKQRINDKEIERENSERLASHKFLLKTVDAAKVNTYNNKL